MVEGAYNASLKIFHLRHSFKENLLL